MKATKNAPEMPIETPGSPSAWITSHRRRPSVVQISPVSSISGTIDRRLTENRPSSNRS